MTKENTEDTRAAVWTTEIKDEEGWKKTFTRLQSGYDGSSLWQLFATEFCPGQRHRQNLAGLSNIVRQLRLVLSQNGWSPFKAINALKNSESLHFTTINRMKPFVLSRPAIVFDLDETLIFTTPIPPRDPHISIRVGRRRF
jgi:hypothetical protein